jgi:hypothetical protein
MRIASLLFFDIDHIGEQSMPKSNTLIALILSIATTASLWVPTIAAPAQAAQNAAQHAASSAVIATLA